MNVLIPTALGAVVIGAAAVAAVAPPQQSGVTFDWTINVGNLLTLLAIAGSFTIWLVSGLNARRDLVRDVELLQDGIEDVKEEMKTMGKVIVQLAEYDIRLTNTDANLVRLQNEVDRMRQGEGFIFPLGRYTPPRQPGD